MLEYLRIRNLALIENMSLEFSEGINVLTGETGAGKSFILKALNFLFGERLGAEMVRPGAERAQVEAFFSGHDEDLIIRRDLLSGSGRSRLYINDELRTQESARELKPRLLVHTSQHAQQRLLSSQFQNKLLDHILPRPELLAKRSQLLDSLAGASEKRQQILSRQGVLLGKKELLEMQNQEIAKISPMPGEEEELERQKEDVRSTQQRGKYYKKACGLLYGENGPGFLDLAAELERVFQHLEGTGENFGSLAADLKEIRQRMLSAGDILRHPADIDEKKIDHIEERLFVLAQLKRKLKRTLPEIIALQEEINQNLSFLDICNLDLIQLEKEERILREDLKKTVEMIVPDRRKAANKLANGLEIQLRDLGFSEFIQVIPDFESTKLWDEISDERVRFLWAPNPGQIPQPLEKIASGGELSRFLLALTTLQNDNRELTYIFDEVDAGIGGLTLNKVGEKLQSVAKSNQIILVTHWPQLASIAKKHFRINKEIQATSTVTTCSEISGTQREAELARMAGGM